MIKYVNGPGLLIKIKNTPALLRLKCKMSACNSRM
jgi:hypothetical protein